MKKTKTPIRPVVLTIAGSDSAGMAGIAMDIRTQSVLGIHTLCAITANTAQNNAQVLSVNPVDANTLQNQLDAASAVLADVIKVGLICNSAQARIIKRTVESLNIPLVLDPVLTASSGSDFSDGSTQDVIRDELIPLCSLITPNLDEAEKLTGIQINSAHDMSVAAQILLQQGAKAVLIKGGHFKTRWSQDLFMDLDKSFWLSSKRIESVNMRGTGCALASTIASALALGYSIYDSVVIGKMAINQGIRLGYSTEVEQGPIAIDEFPNQQIDLPCLTQTADFPFQQFQFKECNHPPLGLYPVVNRANWIERLAPLGISTMQLRVKDLAGDDLESEIINAIQLAEKYNCRLFINDYWQLAIKHKAYGIHLGQEDLDDADLAAIQNAGLRLGTSTHCHYEVARAHSYRPSYIACGPVYHTNTKQMPWIPHGINGLQYWRNVLNYPLVAIGGINQGRLKAVAETGVDSIAMITAITEADNPEQTASEFLKQIAL